MDVNVQSEQELIEFARGLQNLSEILMSNFYAAHQELERVSLGWNDRQNEKFREEFQEVCRGVQHISEMIYNHSCYIKRYAQAVETAKNVR